MKKNTIVLHLILILVVNVLTTGAYTTYAEGSIEDVSATSAPLGSPENPATADLVRNNAITGQYQVNENGTWKDFGTNAPAMIKSDATPAPGVGRLSTSDDKGITFGDFEITTHTSEPCLFSTDPEKSKPIGDSKDPQLQIYECKISAQTGFQTMIANIYKYVFFISIVIAVLILVAIGILMSVSGVFPEGEEMKNKAKEKLIQMLIGVLALALIPWILKTVAPFVFK